MANTAQWIEPAVAVPEQFTRVRIDADSTIRETNKLNQISNTAQAAIDVIDEQFGETALDPNTIWGRQREFLKKALI